MLLLEGCSSSISLQPQAHTICCVLVLTPTRVLVLQSAMFVYGGDASRRWNRTSRQPAQQLRQRALRRVYPTQSSRRRCARRRVRGGPLGVPLIHWSKALSSRGRRLKRAYPNPKHLNPVRQIVLAGAARRRPGAPTIPPPGYPVSPACPVCSLLPPAPGSYGGGQSLCGRSARPLRLCCAEEGGVR